MNTNKTNLLTAVQTASDQCKTFFNKRDALGCASCYEENAVMIAKPLGVFNGKKKLSDFGQNFLRKVIRMSSIPIKK